METYTVYLVSILTFVPEIFRDQCMQEKILEKSTDLFLKFGYKSVTMDDIAAELSISKKTVYKYFKTKLDLVKASVIQLHKNCEAIITEIADDKKGAIEESYEIKDRFDALFSDIKMSPIYQLRKFYPEVYTEILDKDKDCHDEHFKVNLEKGIKDGDFRSDIDIDFVTKVYFRLLYWIHSHPDIQQMAQNETKLLEYHLRAIVTPTGLTKLEKQLSKYEES